MIKAIVSMNYARERFGNTMLGIDRHTFPLMINLPFRPQIGDSIDLLSIFKEEDFPKGFDASINSVVDLAEIGVVTFKYSSRHASVICEVTCWPYFDLSDR